LREIDIDFMKRLAPRINIIPIISKADSMTPSELQSFKKQVMSDIALFKIPIYDFPSDPEEDPEEIIKENDELRAMLPFAIIGAEKEVNIGGI
jgi:cell division control protein 11